MTTNQPPQRHVFKTVKDVESQPRPAWRRPSRDLQHDMAAIRTGRASVGILDNIRVDYYGTPTPLNQVANLHVPEPSLITISRGMCRRSGRSRKSIRASDLGLNPANDGKMIRVPIPAADRRAPQGNRQAAAPRGRRSSRGGAQHPPRRQ